MDRSNGGSRMAASVTIAVTSSAGVTSNEKFTAVVPGGEIGRSRRPVTSSGERSTILSTSPRAISAPTLESVTSLNGMPSRASSQAVSLAPWRSGRVSSTQTCVSRPACHAARRIPPAVP